MKRCHLCELPFSRRIGRVTEHHLTPRETTKGEENITTIPLHKICHALVHWAESNESLATHYNTEEKLLNHPVIAKFRKEVAISLQTGGKESATQTKHRLFKKWQNERRRDKRTKRDNDSFRRMVEQTRRGQGRATAFVTRASAGRGVWVTRSSNLGYDVNVWEGRGHMRKVRYIKHARTLPLARESFVKMATMKVPNANGENGRFARFAANEREVQKIIRERWKFCGDAV